MVNTSRQVLQTLNLLFLHTMLNRALWKLSLFGIGILLFAIVISVEWMIFFAVPFIAMAPIILFMSFHRQLFWVAGNRQLNSLPGIHTQLFICFIAVVTLAACCLILIEFLIGRSGSVHIGAAISLSIVFNCAALCVAYFSSLAILVFWIIAIIKSGAIWQNALNNSEWLIISACASMVLLSLNWKRWMSASLRSRASSMTRSDSFYWQAFFRRHIALLSEHPWRPQSLLGSLLLGRADNPWRGVLGLAAIFFVLLSVAVATSGNSARSFQEIVLNQGVNLAVVVWMIGSPQFMIGRVYDNLARLWLVFPGGRRSLLLYVEGRLLRQIAINCFVVIAIVMSITIFLEPRLLVDPIQWVRRLSVLVGLVLLQYLYFYVSLWIYLRSEGDRKWNSTVVSVLTILIIFAVSFVAGKVEANYWDFSLVAVATLTVLLVSVSVLRVWLVNAWPRISLIRRVC